MLLNKLGIILFLFFGIFVPKTLSAQWEAYNDSLCNRAYQQVIALNFHEADRLLALERNLHPNNLYVLYIENMKDLLAAFISEEQALLDTLDKNKDVRIEKIERLPDSNPYKRWMLANINVQCAFTRTKFEEFFTAALEINRAYRYISENGERFPGFVPNLNTLGVMHIVVGLVPDQYHWVLSILSMEGTIEQGRAELYKVLNMGLAEKEWGYLKVEALFYIGLIELNLSSNHAALNRILPYLEREPVDNVMLDYLKVRIYMMTGKNDKALAILNAVDTLQGHYPFYFLDYLHGECNFRELRPDAMVYYNKYLNRFHGLLYIKDSWYKKALVAYLFQNIEVYYSYLDSVLVHGTEIVGADKIAQKYAEEKAPPPNRALLEVRLLFDGGYYKKALEHLDNIQYALLMPDERLECYYRYGRIYHEMNDPDKAKQYYQMTIDNKGESMRYFAPNAALKLGQIYESEGYYKKAKTYYEKCLDMDFDEYYNSIRAKAKDGLERIELEIKSHP